MANETAKRKKSDYMHMRVTPELKAQITAEAKKRFIDTSALISLVLAEWLQRNREKPSELSEVKRTDEDA